MKASEKPSIHVDVGWAKEYQPWLLLVRSMSLVGKQVLPLMLAYWKICEWNPEHYLITLHCQISTYGMLAYPCEATKAFARCFPLLAISVSLVVTGRFILQSRIYFHLLVKGAILDFQNYKFYKDPAVVLLVFCFSMGALHFLLDLCYPPYLVNHIEKMSNICMFALPCVVFFVVFESGCNVEKHLVTLNKFYEEDPDVAQEFLSGVNFYSEEQIRASASQVMESHSEDRVSLDTLLDETIKGATTSRAALHEASNEGSNVPETLRTSLFRALWPGQILLDEGLTDEASKSFKRAIRSFMAGFVVVHLVLLTLLLSSAARELGDTMPYREHPNDLKPGTLLVDQAHYQGLGEGYCRDDSMQRPECYWVEWKVFSPQKTSTGPPRHRPRKAKGLSVDPVQSPRHAAQKHSAFLSVSTNFTSQIMLTGDVWTPAWMTQKDPWPKHYIDVCARHCSSSSNCIGFSVDPEFCSIYNSEYTKAPTTWQQAPIAHDTARSSSMRRTARIVQTNTHELATCWSKQDMKGEPQDIMGVIVCVSHAFIVAFIGFHTFLRMKNEETICDAMKCW